MTDTTTFGDICTTIGDQDIEDIFNEKNNYSKKEITILEQVLTYLVNIEYTSRKQYDNEVKHQRDQISISYICQI